MKRLLVIPFLLPCFCFGQDFSFPLFFEDSAGNVDTLVLGYDLTATDAIDTAFGEVNIITLPFDSGLDVRVTNGYREAAATGGLGTIETKKQIAGKDCNDTSNAYFHIDIRTTNWPIKIYWDKSLFTPSCRELSFITDWPPGGWFDAFHGNEEILFDLKDINTVYSYYDSPPFWRNSYGDTVKVVHVVIGNMSVVGINEPPLISDVSIHPNPTTGIFTVQGATGTIQVYDLFGRLVFTATEPTIDMSSYPAGIYMVRLALSEAEGAGEAVRKLILQ